MLEILLKTISTVLCFMFVTLLVTALYRWLRKNDDYHITFEYKMFVLAKDHAGGTFKFESWERLKALGADGWEIAETLESDYEGICFILKRETFHKS